MVGGAASFRSFTSLSITNTTRGRSTHRPLLNPHNPTPHSQPTMNPSDRTKKALLGTSPSNPLPFLPSITNSPARSELLCAAIHDDTTNAKNSSGGTSYLSKILHAVKLEETSAYAAVPTLGPANDYYTSAQRELTIREQSAGLVRHVSTSNAKGGLRDAKLTYVTV